MSFLSPERLVLLVPVAALAIAYVALQRRRRRYAVRFTNLDLLDTVAPRRPGWRRHVPAGIAGLAAAAMVAALARPVAAMEVATEDAVVVLAIDTSTSMDATDVSPSRMAAAVAEAVDFVDRLPDGIEVGLVSFDGTARVLSAPTDDHDAVAAAIESLVTGRGTAGGDAIRAALSTIEATLAESDADVTAFAATADTGDDSSTAADDSSDAPAATIVMLSDGATTVGTDVLVAAALAADAGVPVSTITYGTESGVVAVEGRTASVPPDTETMQEVADITGGTAFAAASADELEAVYADIEARVGTTIEQRELALGFVATAFVLLLGAAAAAFVWTGRFL